MKGIRRDRYGFRAYVKVGPMQREKRFKPTATVTQMQAWRDECRVSLRKLAPEVCAPGSLQADVDRYGLQVRAMPTYTERVRHLTLWVAAFGPATPRHTITVADIRTVLQQWRHAGLAPATCNKRRTALMHLWTILDGKGGSNPVRGVPKFPAPHALPRGKDPHVIDAALKRARPSRSRACCRVMLWTGMRPLELDRAKPEDVDLKAQTVIVRTVKGGRVRLIPLTSQAVQAWREFENADAWQRVPQAAPLNLWLKRITGTTMRVYDLRHSYGTALARRQTRLDVIGALMGHSTLELTKRYTLAAITPDAAGATKRLARKTASKLPAFGRRKAAGAGGQRRKAS